MVPLLLLIAFLVLQKVIVVIMKRSTKSKSSFIKYTLILKAAKWSTGVSLKTESLIGLFSMLNGYSQIYPGINPPSMASCVLRVLIPSLPAHIALDVLILSDIC